MPLFIQLPYLNLDRVENGVNLTLYAQNDYRYISILVSLIFCEYFSGSLKNHWLTCNIIPTAALFHKGQTS
ncbi:hypothetical protein JF634_08590 [Simonsiella muelleri]|uniref:Uncharacterized protein n=1 Tax=Simonsiella muelleri ATCC 29453 TaxID=641147 RepID=V9HLE1_9NEIS|nr:hypothetical protein [Simonsiella muelleri]EFG31014.1 hypothetical protein HMPREF9021_01242 [Simonsiella muelleri ATCC 29453]UBQ53247.1 hypothetical protein JF634_08590 [Simonsiella muelleri]